MFVETKYEQKLAKYFPGEQKKLLEKLLSHARYLYDSLYRYSGESYYLRSLRLTVEKILPMSPDIDTIMASVLVSACYSRRCNLSEIEKLFGMKVREMVESLGRINSIKARYSESDNKVIARMFLHLASDIRVILIRLMDRIENVETLKYKSEEKQKANAKEILEVYVPIASQLGLYQITLQLEDLAFRYCYPQDYDLIKKDIDDYMGKTKVSMDAIKVNLKQMLRKEGFDVEVSGRIKNVFSIYKKMKKKSRTLDKIYDIYAMRIILNTKGNSQRDSKEEVQKLYAILSFLHSKFKYRADRFKDYISRPKGNGYQSLHTAIIGLDPQVSKPTEIQIRTNNMHSFAEYGLAAHWIYKRTNINGNLDQKFINALNSLRTNLEIDHTRTAALKINLYPNRVFVMTDDNLVKDLPKGATPIDLAYAIDPDTGHHCQSVKINGEHRSVESKLNSGDIVEIITDNNASPRLHWLSHVVTKHARNRIKNFFRNLDKEDLQKQGKSEFNELLRALKFPLLDSDLNFLRVYQGRRLGSRERELLLEDIGSGVVDAKKVFEDTYGQDYATVYNAFNSSQEKPKEIDLLPNQRKTSKSEVNQDLLIGGERDIPYRIANCCNPKLQDEITAFVTKNNMVSIHRISCKFVKNAESSRLLSAVLVDESEAESVQKYQIAMVLEINERQGYIVEIVNLLMQYKIKILDFSVLRRDFDKIYRKLVVDLHNQDQFDELVDKLGMISGILKVSRM